MYKKLELLSKTKHKDLKLSPITSFEFAKNLRYIPVGLSEIPRLSSILPIVISGGETRRFVVLTSFGNYGNYFSLDRCKDIYVPGLLRAYPFAVVEAAEEGTDKKYRAMAIDVESEFVGEKGEYPLFEEGEISKYAKPKFDLAWKVDADILAGQRLIKDLENLGVLKKSSLTLKTPEGKEYILISEFYTINKEELLEKLGEKKIYEWTKQGLMFYIDSYIHSLRNLRRLLPAPTVMKTMTV